VGFERRGERQAFDGQYKYHILNIYMAALHGSRSDHRAINTDRINRIDRISITSKILNPRRRYVPHATSE